MSEATLAAASPLRRALDAVTPASAAVLVALGALVSIASALFIEHGLGVKPCELCLLQRWPYYIGIPLAVLAALLARAQPRSRLTMVLLVLLAVVFLVGAGLGLYHSGVELKLWQGPTGCTGPVTRPGSMGDFLKQLETVKVVRCDEIAMRILGLTLPNWNTVIAAGLACLAAFGALRARPIG